MVFNIEKRFLISVFNIKKAHLLPSQTVIQQQLVDQRIHILHF